MVEAFNSTSRYLDDLVNIDNTYFDGIVKQIYPSDLQLNHLYLTISDDGFVSSKIYDKHYNF